MFSSSLIKRLSSAEFSTDDVRAAVDELVSTGRTQGFRSTKIGAAARALDPTGGVDLALAIAAELPWTNIALARDPSAWLLFFGLPGNKTVGKNALLDMSTGDLHALFCLLGRHNAELARTIIQAVEAGDETATATLTRMLANLPVGERAQFSIDSVGAARERIADLLRANSSEEEEITFLTQMGCYAPATHAQRIAAQNKLTVAPEPVHRGGDAMLYAEEHRSVIDLLFQRYPEKIWDHLQGYIGNPWLTNQFRMLRLVGTLPWDESLHIVGGTDVWHGFRLDKAVLIAKGQRGANKKGASSLKVHKTVAAAQKELKSKAEAESKKLGIEALARPTAPANAADLLLEAARCADRYGVESVLMTGIDPNVRDAEQRSALHRLEGQDVECARMMLDAGATPAAVLDQVAGSSSPSALATTLLLRARGADWADRDAALARALRQGQTDIARMLLELGSTPSEQDVRNAEVGTRAHLKAAGLLR